MTRALRVRLIVDDNHLELHSIIPVDAFLPPSDTTTQAEELSGSWFELRDTQDQTLYRRRIPQLTQDTREVFTGDVEESIVRPPDSRGPTPVFFLVPDTSAARDVVLFTSRMPRLDRTSAAEAGTPAAATEIGRFIIAPGA
jgi:hypothetical protein